MGRYSLTTAAKSDINEISAYIRRDNPEAAKRVRAAIRSAMKQLAEMPGLGHLRDDLVEERVKFWSVYSYMIVYRPNTQPIEILRVLHGARDVGAILGRYLEELS